MNQTMSTTGVMPGALRSNQTGGGTTDDSRPGWLPSNAVSWGSIAAGAIGAAALSLILLVLGTGFGLASVSPWASRGVGATTFGASTIVWITITSLIASGMGGYLAGRLRTRWSGTHQDEVYFRDTAHGFLAWALATLITAATLTSAIGSIVGGSAQVGAAVAGSTATAAMGGAAAAVMPGAGSAGSQGAANPFGYFVDSLFRRETAASSTGTSSTGNDDAQSFTAEAGRVLTNALGSGTMPAEDTKYLARLIARRTGLAEAEAEKRVTDTFTRVQSKVKETETAAREATDKARKASAYAALWLFVSLLGGAFAASLAATYGGRQRDQS